MKKISTFILEKRRVLLWLFIIFTGVSLYLSTLVEINTDLTAYLPAGSNLRIGLDTMYDEFGDDIPETVHVMFSDLTEVETQNIHHRLSNLQNVAEVLFIAGSDKHQRDEFSLFTLILEIQSTSEEEEALVNAIEIEFNDYTFVLSGGIEGIDDFGDEELALVMVATIIISAVILLVMCRSWIEPIIILVNISVAVIFNMGTNVLFEHISDTTELMAVVLQVALSLDYAVIFLNRYYREKDLANGDLELAMKNTIRHSFSTVFGIAFTTIVAMLMLAFMSFTLGADIGFVIAKGVFLSLVCVFGVMPALVLQFDKLIEKTRKPVPRFNMNKIGSFAFKARYGILLFFVVLSGISFMIYSQLEFQYAEDAIHNPIHQTFDLENGFVVLYENSDEVLISTFIESFEANEHVLGINAYRTTIGQGMTEAEFASELEFDQTIIGLVFRNFFLDVPPSTSLDNFLTFLQTNVANHEWFGAMMTPEILEQLEAFSNTLDDALLSETVDPQTLAAVFQIDIDMINQLLYLYDIVHGDELRVTLLPQEFIRYVLDEFSQVPLFQPHFTDDILNELKFVYDSLSDMRGMLVADNYSRLLIHTRLDVESEETFRFIEQLGVELEQVLASGFYIVSESMLSYEMNQSFPSEFSFISILTAIAFFIVAIFVFRSISVSALLVAVIQSAVFIAMAVLVLQTDDAGVGFLSLIIAQVLLKSRVIDYGILYASNYIEARKDHEIKQATITALENSIETIVTSGLIITLIMLVSGLIFLPINQSIAEIFLVVAQGCFIGILLSIFVLPSLIIVFDRFVSKARSTGGH